MGRALATLPQTPASAAARSPATATRLLLLGILFGAAYSQYPLYYLVQNQYFFYALAREGMGLLRGDWLSATFDPWPVFTQLAYLTYRYLDQNAFYVYFVVLLAFYALTLSSIANTLFGVMQSRVRYLPFLALLAAVHSPVFAEAALRVAGINLRLILIEGVASQRIMWDMFQPGAFGVLLLLSVDLFLRRRTPAAGGAAALSVLFNPAYALSAGVLTSTYLMVMARRGERFRRIAAVGATALAIVLPILVYLAAGVRGAGPDVAARAQEILVRFRLDVHASPATWLTEAVFLKLAVILAALLVIRRTDLFLVMALGLAATIVLTAAQLLSRSTALALLYPWRLSVVLVPLATTILIAYGVTGVLDRVERRSARAPAAVATVSAVLMAILMVGGVALTIQRFREVPVPATAALERFVRRTKAPGETYLIPLVLTENRDRDPLGYHTEKSTWQRFRLSTGAPTFIDWGFIPYRDTEVLQWAERVRAADAFYTAGEDERCRMAGELQSRYGVTHLVLQSRDPAVCRAWRPVLRDGVYTLYALP
jgi:hypothetical protein